MMHRRYAVLIRFGIVALLGLGGRTVSVGNAVAGVPSAADIKLTQVIDVNTINGDLTALEDPQSNTLVLIYREAQAAPRVLVGNGRLFFEQVFRLSTTDFPDIAFYMVAPRARPDGRTALSFTGGKYTYTCDGDGKDTVALTTLPPMKLAKALDKATFRSSALVRRTAMLARDAAGIYYFVDRLRDESSGFRVFVGKRGKLKQLPLVDVADDEAGMVFETKTGELRLMMDKNKERTVTWSVKDKAKALKWLDPDGASYLIKRELGIYAGFGTLCDDR